MTKSLMSVTSQKADTAAVEAIYSYADMDGIQVLTFTDVMEEYYPYWSTQMLKRGGRSPLITTTNCLEDWKCVHWASYN